MPRVVSILLASIATWFRSRLAMQMELLALRHQVAVYKQSITRPKLQPADRWLWVWLSRWWPGWQQALAFVQPRTVIAWQNKRFRDYWRRLSQKNKLGHPTISKKVIELIRDMWRSNPTWGSPRIVGKLHKIGIEVAKSTVEKYRPRSRNPSSPVWRAFLNNHVKDLVSCDFFTVPTVTFKVLFVFVIFAHERRRIVHSHVTEHPTAQWTAQQIVEAFPWDEALRYLLAGSRRDLRRAVPTPRRQHGPRRSQDCPSQAVAKSVCGTAHRQHLQRVPERSDYAERKSLTARASLLHGLLSHVASPPVSRHGRTDASPGSALRSGASPKAARSRWAASSLRANSSVRDGISRPAFSVVTRKQDPQVVTSVG